VAGLMLRKVSPDFASTHSPLIKLRTNSDILTPQLLRMGYGDNPILIYKDD
jgi:hypothetical protein